MYDHSSCAEEGWGERGRSRRAAESELTIARQSDQGRMDTAAEGLLATACHRMAIRGQSRRLNRRTSANPSQMAITSL